MIALALLSIAAQAAASPPPTVYLASHLPPDMVAELQQVVRPPKPLQPIQGLVSPDDYPAGATGRGTVAINLLITKQGIAGVCEITQSGGSPQLDSATCQLLKRRARFTPAVDRNGKPSLGLLAVQVDWDRVLKGVRVIRGKE
jgi:protein TonB